MGLLPFLLQDIALEPGMMGEDGIHPTAAAQPLILEQVWSALQPLLSGPVPATQGRGLLPRGSGRYSL